MTPDRNKGNFAPALATVPVRSVNNNARGGELLLLIGENNCGEQNPLLLARFYPAMQNAARGEKWGEESLHTLKIAPKVTAGNQLNPKRMPEARGSVKEALTQRVAALEHRLEPWDRDSLLTTVGTTSAPSYLSIKRLTKVTLGELRGGVLNYRESMGSVGQLSIPPKLQFL